MNRKYIINGTPINDEKELRKFAMEFSPEKGKKAFKQDFRLIAGARTKPVSELIDMLETNGAVVEIVE